ncbi:MAG TPA: SDR family oxidoreductase [Thermomonas sp.]|nr:SDR family oxidoreductase [Thermomonas sp.]
MSGIIEIGTITPAILVLGAAGDIGRGVVQALLEAGKPVLAVDADAAALASLHGQHPRAPLTTLVAAIASDADAARLAASVRAHTDGGIAGVVASIAGRHDCARLLDQPADALRRTLDEDLMPQLFAARHLLPLLRTDDGAGYVLIGGPGGDYPWAGYGHCSIAAAALRMMVRVLHDEAAGLGVRVQLLALDAPVQTDANAAQAGHAWPKAIAIGRRALALLDADRMPAAPVVGFRGDLPATTAASTPRGRAPARDLRDARALLASIRALPPLLPGPLPHETR